MSSPHDTKIAEVQAPEAEVEVEESFIEEELLVEEISIDGMCGVY